MGEDVMIVRCPICTKDAPAGSVHTCTPTEAWRQATAQMDHYRKALEAIVKHQETINPTMGITGALAVPDISETESDRG